MSIRTPLTLCLGLSLAAACFGDSGRGETLAVSAIQPADSAMGVEVDAPLLVTFSKLVKAESVTPASFVVSRAGAPVSGLVTVSGANLLFTPLRPFAPLTAYSARVTTAVTDTGDHPLAEEKVWTFTTGAVPDRTPPTVARTTPVPDAEDVSPRVAVKVGFSETMRATTVGAQTLVLYAGTTRIDGAVSFDGSTVTFTPFSALAPNSLYTATLNLGPEDLVGNALASAMTWSFRTVEKIDAVAPTVAGTTPANGASEVPVSASIRITFSEPMDPLTLNAASVLLSDGMTFVAGSVTASGDTAIFTPAAPLRMSTRYTLVVEVGATDLLRNELPGRSTINFTTGPAIPMEGLAVASINPLQGATLVAVDGTVSAAFSRAIDPATLNSASFTLARGDSLVGTTISAAGQAAVLTPVRPLEPATTYTATLTTAVRDTNGLALPMARAWTFTTGPTPDRTPPAVTQVSPADQAEGVSLTPSLTASFTEVLDPSTVNAQTLLVSTRGAATSGQVSLNGNVVRFTPTSALAPSTTYTATLSIALKDVAGNALIAPYTWRFTTQRTPDFTPPAVTGSAPGPGATGIPVTTAIIVNFSEAVDPSSVTPVSFTLAKDNNPIAATVYGAGRTAILAPTAPLENGATYIVTVWSLITDMAGNPLPQNQNWFFTTAPRPDTTAPFLVSTTPSPGRQDVAITTTVTAVFSEAIDVTSVTPVTFTLSSPSAQIAGAVSVNGSAAVFAPNSALIPATRYTATVFGSVRDVAGNPMNSSYTWSFVTTNP